MEGLLSKDWTGRSPINHLVNGGFSAGTAGWTSTGDVTVSIVSGKLRLNASVADKGVYQAANGLEPNALYTIVCKVSTGGKSARIYTTGGHHNADEIVMTAATATWVGQSLTASSGVLTIHLTAHTTGVDIDFDDVRLFRGNLAFPFVDDVHDVVGGDHIVDGTSMQLVGLTADDTLGLLTPSADPGAASKVLKSDANGKLALVGLDVDGGSASSPSLTLAGDTNTGLYQSAADNLDITTGGTQRVNVGNNGLDVKGDYYIDGNRIVQGYYSGSTSVQYSNGTWFSVLSTGNLGSASGYFLVGVEFSSSSNGGVIVGAELLMLASMHHGTNTTETHPVPISMGCHYAQGYGIDARTQLTTSASDGKTYLQLLIPESVTSAVTFNWKVIKLL